MIVEFDPVALDLGFIAVHWYGLAYLVGFLGALYWAKWLLRRYTVAGAHFGVDADALDNILTIAIVGVVVGGRLGEVLFYHPWYYWANPGQIIMIWQGGMSFHGGVIGVFLGIWWFSRHRKLSLRATGDLVCAGIPIGIFFGRIANFINGELWGRAVDVPGAIPWAVIVPQSGIMVLRHPSQIYEALLEGLLLFVLLFGLVRCGALCKQGIVAGAFLVGYGVARSIAEFFREPEVNQGLLWAGLTWGQWLSVPLVLAGGVLIILAFRAPSDTLRTE